MKRTRGYRGEIFIKYNIRQSLRLTQREIMLEPLQTLCWAINPDNRGKRLRAFMYALTSRIRNRAAMKNANARASRQSRGECFMRNRDQALE